MRKFLLTGIAALALCAGFTSCSHDFDVMSQEEIDALQAQKVTKTYENAFKNYVGGKIASNQDWGFGNSNAARTRSEASPEVKGISAPYSDSWVEDYLATASEPNENNISNNDANAGKKITTPVVMPSVSLGDYPTYCIYNQSKVTTDDVNFYDNTFKNLWAAYEDAETINSSYNNEENYVTVNNAKIDKFMDVYNAVLEYAGEDGVTNWLNITQMPQKGEYGAGDFVTHFKITGTGNNAWTGGISVVATEGLTDGVANNCERTVVVTGKWNLTEDQRVGSKGRIIIADGGELAISEGATLEMVNQARLVVLGTGKITGAGNISVTNGNEAGFENYIDAGAEINITGTFNNNFGKLYNYGTFKAGTYAAGGSGEENAGASCFYNHGLVVINDGGTKGSYVSTNARIFNNCQWYCKKDMRAYILELAGGSSFIVDGELQLSGGNDGSDDPSYVGMASGALLQCGTLYNNGTSWTGPTNGYSVLSTGSIVFLNWEQDAPETGGYFANNIYVQADTWTNTPGGNGTGGETALEKFKKVQNAKGNGNVTIIEKGTTEIINADANFVKGQSGCTPGFKGDTTTSQEEDPGTPDLRIIAEDLNANGTDNSDFDFNDVVIDVYFGEAGAAKAEIVAAGGTLNLRVDGQEVHELFNQKNNRSDCNGMMINTNGTKSALPGVKSRSIDGLSHPVITLSKSVLSNADARDNIVIEVYKNDMWIPLSANKGEAASKIGVDPSYEYCDEREDIITKYPGFKSWVEGQDKLVWWE